MPGQQTDKMVNLALIIKYKNKSIYKDLPRMLEDAKMMKAMLSSHNYEIELHSDVKDIGNQLEKFVEKWKK